MKQFGRMGVGRFHHDDVAELAAKAHHVVRPTQFPQVEGSGQAFSVIFLVDVYGHVTVPFGSSLFAGDLIIWKSH